MTLLAVALALGAVGLGLLVIAAVCERDHVDDGSGCECCDWTALDEPRRDEVRR